MLWAPAAHAVVMVSDGPCQPMRMETAAAPALVIIIGTNRGETLRAPFSPKMRIWVSRVSRPPTPVPMMTAQRPVSAVISPASSKAMEATATLNWANRSVWRASLTVNHRSGSKSGTRRSPMGGGPLSPDHRASVPTPQHETTPTPVMATRRPDRQVRCPVASDLCGDEIECLADGFDAIEFGLVHGDVEGLFEGHDQFDQIEAVGIQVLGEPGLPGHLAGRHLKHFHRALLELLECLVVAHWIAPSSGVARSGDGPTVTWPRCPTLSRRGVTGPWPIPRPRAAPPR